MVWQNIVLEGYIKLMKSTKYNSWTKRYAVLQYPYLYCWLSKPVCWRNIFIHSFHFVTLQTTEMKKSKQSDRSKVVVRELHIACVPLDNSMRFFLVPS